jgi:hypothetical protein
MRSFVDDHGAGGGHALEPGCGVDRVAVHDPFTGHRRSGDEDDACRDTDSNSQVQT